MKESNNCLSSKGIPPKFYIDGNLNVRELSVNFGIDIQAFVPLIVSAIDRLNHPLQAMNHRRHLLGGGTLSGSLFMVISHVTLEKSHSAGCWIQYIHLSGVSFFKAKNFMLVKVWGTLSLPVPFRCG